MLPSFARAVVVAAIVMGGAGSALADRIDGDWCLEGNHFSISGPDIVTPGGVKMKGDYTRHTFSYVAPPPETDAGTPIVMQLMNETTLRLHVGEDAAAPWQVWRRCDPTS